MQVAALDSLGATVYTLVYSSPPPNTGYFTQSYTTMFPGQPFQIRGHIRTNNKRNDTVTVTASVQKRPDVTVYAVYAPPRAPVNTPIQIGAVIAELNGDVGAHTDCVLYVNDVEADRANGIWVDSGDAVTCAFNPTFTSTGSNNVKVRAVNVDPSDWDMDNNVAETDVLVSTITPDWDLAWAQAKVYDENNTTVSRFGRYVNTTVTAGYDWLVQDVTDTAGDIWTYTGAAADVPWTPTSVTASASDGIASWTATRAVGGCSDFSFGTANGRTFWTSITGCSSLWVQAGTYSGTVTYTSRGLVRTFTVVSGKVAYDGPAQYVYNTVETTDVNGTAILNGSNFTIDVQVQAGPFTFSKPLSFPVSAGFSDQGQVPETCGTASGVVYCEAATWSKIWRTGATVFIRP
jgi:hypothetical protein